MKKVIIIDTSMLCVWLKVDKMDTCGNDDDKWDFDRIDRLIQAEKKKNTTLVLPLATIIETGNHIAQAANKRYETAQALAELIIAAADGTTPWAVFTEQSVLWESEELKKLAQAWPSEAAKQLSIGDATIGKVAKYYKEMGLQVDILTGDRGLNEYCQEMMNTRTPRRRKNN